MTQIINLKLFFLFLYLINLNIQNINGYKILGIVPTSIKSHYHVGSAIMKGLADRGHEVTVIAPFTNSKAPKNWRDLQTYDVEKYKISVKNFIDNPGKTSMLDFFKELLNFGVNLTNTTLHEINVQKLIKSKNETFDAIIMEIFFNEAMLGLSLPLNNIPIIGYSTFGASLWSCEMVGSPSPPSYVPNPMTGFSDHMTFKERFANVISVIMDQLFYDFIYFPKQEEIYNDVFKDYKNRPSLKELQKNVSLVLLNNHFTIGYPRPYMPNMIEVGGIHIDMSNKKNQLPNDIKKVLDSSKNGVIYFSMGSYMKSNMMSKDKLEAILNAFKSLEKYDIIWKFENETLPGQPKNLLIKDWMPQSDILAHPNVKVFITHGGLLGTTEAVYHGVPLIGIPMFADQFFNIRRFVQAKIGIKLNYLDITTETFKNSINEILSNPIYAKNMKEFSQKYRDQPMKPLDKAMFWIEYVIRHRGAPEIHSAGQNLSFIEYHNLDIFAILIGGSVLILYLLLLVLRKILRLISKPKESFDKNKKE